MAPIDIRPRRRQGGAHRVLAVGFVAARLARLPSSAALVDCACSWSGTVEGFDSHRLEPGQRLLLPRSAPVTVVAEPSPWRRTTSSTRKRVVVDGRQLTTGCVPEGVAGGPCQNCGRDLMLGGAGRRRRVQHKAPRPGASS